MKWVIVFVGGIAIAFIVGGYFFAGLGLQAILNSDTSDDEVGMALASGAFLATVYGGFPLALLTFASRKRFGFKSLMFLGLMSLLGLALLPCVYVAGRFNLF